MARYKIQDFLHIFLPKGLEYHHINMDRKNNSMENIVVLDIKLHRKLHKEIRYWKAKGYERLTD